jgi:hypothetical protein
MARIKALRIKAYLEERIKVCEEKVAKYNRHEARVCITDSNPIAKVEQQWKLYAYRDIYNKFFTAYE